MSEQPTTETDAQDKIPAQRRRHRKKSGDPMPSGSKLARKAEKGKL